MTRTVWEHRLVKIPFGARLQDETLNAMGEDGFEAVAMTLVAHGDEPAMLILMKRPKLPAT